MEEWKRSRGRCKMGRILSSTFSGLGRIGAQRLWVIWEERRGEERIGADGRIPPGRTAPTPLNTGSSWPSGPKGGEQHPTVDSLSRRHGKRDAGSLGAMSPTYCSACSISSMWEWGVPLTEGCMITSLHVTWVMVWVHPGEDEWSGCCVTDCQSWNKACFSASSTLRLSTAVGVSYTDEAVPSVKAETKLFLQPFPSFIYQVLLIVHVLLQSQFLHASLLCCPTFKRTWELLGKSPRTETG